MAVTDQFPASAAADVARRPDDLEALGEALAARYPAVRRFAAVTADADLDPDDLVQEAFTRVFRIARTAGAPEHLDAYLRTTVLNLVTAERRSRGRARAREARLPAPASSSSDHYPSDVAALLRHADPLDRALVFLVDIEGGVVNEVAPHLGLSPVAARARLSRARTRLLAALTADDATSPEEGAR